MSADQLINIMAMITLFIMTVAFGLELTFAEVLAVGKD
jgi:hypothetical protein